MSAERNFAQFKSERGHAVALPTLASDKAAELHLSIGETHF